MLGSNPVRHAERREDGKLQVSGIWYTLQGEGPFAGHPAVFIRLTGCNLRCTFCDTEWNDIDDPYMTVEDIVKDVHAVRPAYCRLIVITGGEPLRQDMSELVPALLRESQLIIQFETAGTLWQEGLLGGAMFFGRVHIVVSPKTPKIHPAIYQYAAAFKYVITEGQTDAEDGLPIVSTQDAKMDGRIARPRPGAPVYLSPCDDLRSVERTLLNEKYVAQLAMDYGYIAGLQLHKIWDIR